MIAWIGWCLFAAMTATWVVTSWIAEDRMELCEEAIERANTEIAIASNLRRINLDLQEELKRTGDALKRSQHASKAAKARWAKRAA